MHLIIGDGELHNIEFDKRWKSPEEKNIWQSRMFTSVAADRVSAVTEVNISLTDSCWENQGINTLAVTFVKRDTYSSAIMVGQDH